MATALWVRPVGRGRCASFGGSIDTFGSIISSINGTQRENSRPAHQCRTVLHCTSAPLY
jgi:hypothetical protein